MLSYLFIIGCRGVVILSVVAFCSTDAKATGFYIERWERIQQGWQVGFFSHLQLWSLASRLELLVLNYNLTAGIAFRKKWCCVLCCTGQLGRVLRQYDSDKVELNKPC